LVAVASVAALGLCVAGLLARGNSSWTVAASARLVALGLLAAGVILGFVAACYLAIGTNNSACGSVLSKLDEHGLYDPDRPNRCAPSYNAEWRGALIAGAAGLVAVAGATWLETVGLQRDRAVG
jgi:hypothetical protein